MDDAGWGMDNAERVGMNTQEARIELRDLARAALGIVEGIEHGRRPSVEDGRDLRKMVAEARVLMADAGFPGETTWRGLSRASLGVDTLVEAPDTLYWHDVAEELRSGLETLESLV